jgi:putative flippase GtrA
VKSVPRLIKFLISGGSAAFLEYAMFVLLVSMFGQKYILLIQAISFLSGFILSFSLNKYWVFSNSNSGKTYLELGKYAILAAINLVISGLLILLLVENIQQNIYVSKVLVMVIIATWNYFVFQKIIFK